MSDDKKTELTVSDPAKEIDAMAQIAKTLSGLDSEAVKRVLSWAKGYYKINGNTEPTEKATPEKAERPKFESFPDLYSAANPSNDMDKALIAAYWLQIVQSQSELDGFAINSQLKDMGYPLSNVTQSLGGLIARKPALILQTKKSGSSQQARKKYKLTFEGKRAVEQMIQTLEPEK